MSAGTNGAPRRRCWPFGHAWSRWVVANFEVLLIDGVPPPKPIVISRQRRTCERCGLSETRSL